jgi:antitoxin (DNA-binding transcriptional repressor) of toxin-antitoxin stability system
VASTSIRELKDNLSRYISRIEAGERIAITAHGRVVAELVPPGTKRPGTPSRFDELVASGVIRPPLESGDPTEDWPDIALPAGTAAELIDADRGEASPQSKRPVLSVCTNDSANKSDEHSIHRVQRIRCRQGFGGARRARLARHCRKARYTTGPLGCPMGNQPNKKPARHEPDPASTASQALRPFLPTVEDCDHFETVGSQPVGITYGVPSTTSSRVPATRPGRPRFGNLARCSTASSITVAIRLAALGLSRSMYARRWAR